MDRILVVDCEEALQVERVMQRSGWPADEVRRVIAQQAPRSARRRIADAVIHNGADVTLDDLDSMVTSLWQRWWP